MLAGERGVDVEGLAVEGDGVVVGGRGVGSGLLRLPGLKSRCGAPARAGM